MHQVARDSAEGELDDLEPTQRANGIVLRLGGILGALAGLSVSGRGTGELTAPERDEQLTALGESAARVSISAAAAEYGVGPSDERITVAAKSTDERVQVVIDNLNAGDLTGPQAANQIQTIVENANWVEYQTEIRVLATDAGETHGNYLLDPSAQHCQDCLARAAANPHPIEEMDTPGDADATECGPGDRCDTEFFTLDASDVAQPEE